MASWSPFQSKLFCKTVSLFASLFFQQPYLVHFSLQKQWTFTINAPVVPIYYILVVIAQQLWCTQTGFHQCNTKFEVSLQDTPNALHSKVQTPEAKAKAIPLHCYNAQTNLSCKGTLQHPELLLQRNKGISAFSWLWTLSSPIFTYFHIHSSSTQHFYLTFLLSFQ